nr:MAG TPA: hypothetical protein [Caudoviricetes sp.]
MENINLESQMYKLNELQAELSRGKEQYEKALPQYEALLDIIEKSGREEELPEGFVSTTEGDMRNIEKGLCNIERRLGYIGILLEKAKENPDVEGIVTLTLLSLGIGLGEFEEPHEILQNEEND